MMNLKELMNRLADEGRDLSALESMIADLKRAETIEEVRYYEGQIYGVLVGLSILGYITPDDVETVADSLEDEGV